MKLSKFGNKFTKNSGILELMDDLDQAMNGPKSLLMLGGGNPGKIEIVEKELHRSMQRILDQKNALGKILGNYDNPQGNLEFIDALCHLFQNHCNWDIGPENIALTNGSQHSFFNLFNILSGEFSDGSIKKILLPLSPEYIGYTDTTIYPFSIQSQRPNIEFLKHHLFKYQIPFDRLQIQDDISAMCVSRPCNPTGNMIEDSQIAQLSSLAFHNNIPLIVDSAYGLPFPGIVFTNASPVWNENMILTMSLSKFGLPGVRTGIVLADPQIIKVLARMNAVTSLATGSVGPALVLDLIRENALLKLSNDVIRPHYAKKSKIALECLHNEMRSASGDIDYLVHESQGAFFLWVWFRNLPITTKELYEHLKTKAVIVVPGEYYFPGLEHDDWIHKHQCIRISFSQDIDQVKQGLKTIAYEVSRIIASNDI